MKKLAIYTAMFGEFDQLYDPLGHLDGTYHFNGEGSIDRFYFTDLDMDGKISYSLVKKKMDYLSPVRRQRKIKICIPGEVFNNYEYSLFLDCRYKLAADPYDLLGFLKSDILLFTHGGRRCAYDEGKVCMRKRENKRMVIKKQLDFYKSQEYPAQNGLYNTGFMIRKHTKKMKELMKSWWKEMEEFSFRDQISLPYVLWKHKFEVTRYPYDDGPGLWIDERSLDVGGK